MDNGAGSYRRFLDGDESAFDDIMHAYFDSLVFFLDRYLHDTGAAEDIAIDAFSDLIVHRHRYNFKVTLKTYLFMIGRSRALNYIKRRNRFRTVELSEVENELADRHSPEEQIFTSELNKKVNDAIEELPDEMKIAVHLVYFEDLSYDEAAKVMKKNKKQIDNLLYRAKNKLRTILGEEAELYL
ncbi:MAG: sigma-70 family RNA polymerase sigma factor [Clostridia bacterium]|nr:sigma-70 family RNA polymerase sigma factor [Clostridia bacterium]